VDFRGTVGENVPSLKENKKAQLT